MLSIRRFRAAHVFAAMCVLSLARVAPAAAQTNRTTLLDYATGSEYEDYLRALQVAGLVELYPWSIRGFSPREIRRLAAEDTSGPWRQATGLDRRSVAAGPLVAHATFNSAFPYGANDGPVWAGRGLTTSISGGVAGGFGPVTLTLAPLAFRAENVSFALLDNRLPRQQRFASGVAPRNVDAPQRFGDGAYSAFDPGNSSLRFDSRAVTFGASTANEWIGPATEYPFLLGNNAAGFPHIFVGTGQPVNVWLAHLHTRVAWGKLNQSDFSPVTGPQHYTSSASTGTVRLATYAEIVALPRGLPGLEVGFARFIHVPYRVGDPTSAFWKKPFKVLFLKNEYAGGDTLGADNQLASAFFRWVFPKSGFELYGERGYEDQFYDRRDLVQRPDHEREYMLGLQKTVLRGASLDVFKGEVLNYQYPAGSVYVHAQLPQGHTNMGQLLGASAGVQSAAASTISWTRYSPDVRTSATLRRIARAEAGDYLASGIVNSKTEDVIVAAGIERTRIGKRVDFGLKIEAMQDFNRNFSNDVPNLNVQITTRLKQF
jgi:hypothetical protein